MRNCATESAPQVELDKTAGAPLLFETRAEHPEREHVEGEVRQPRVDEHVGPERPPCRRKARRVESEDRINGIGPEQREL